MAASEWSAPVDISANRTPNAGASVADDNQYGATAGDVYAEEDDMDAGCARARAEGDASGDEMESARSSLPQPHPKPAASPAAPDRAAQPQRSPHLEPQILGFMPSAATATNTTGGAAGTKRSPKPVIVTGSNAAQQPRVSSAPGGPPPATPGTASKLPRKISYKHVKSKLDQHTTSSKAKAFKPATATATANASAFGATPKSKSPTAAAAAAATAAGGNSTAASASTPFSLAVDRRAAFRADPTNAQRPILNPAKVAAVLSPKSNAASAGASTNPLAVPSVGAGITHLSAALSAREHERTHAAAYVDSSAVDEKYSELMAARGGTDLADRELDLTRSERKYPPDSNTATAEEPCHHECAVPVREVDVRVFVRRAPKQVSELWRSTLLVKPRINDLLLPHLQSQLAFGSMTPPRALRAPGSGFGANDSLDGAARRSSSGLRAADSVYRPTFSTLSACNSTLVSGFF